MRVVFKEHQRLAIGSKTYFQDSAFDIGLKNSYSRKGTTTILLKLIKNCKVDPTYGVHNTLLVDDSPFKAFANPSRTTLFAQMYSPTKDMENDDFLMGLLWLVMNQLQYARDV